MKMFFAALVMFITIRCYSQIDPNGNPVLNSITTGEETIRDFKLIFNYYTLTNNIENKLSSVYISDQPTLDQITLAATDLPSEFFLITKGQTVICMVMIVNKPARKFLVLNPATGKQSEFSCALKGAISENRANEIIDQHYDPKAKIDGFTLRFNKKRYEIIPNRDIRTEIVNLIEKQQLDVASDSIHLKILFGKELRTMILNETKEGGKLDFFTPIKGKEMETIRVKSGAITTRISMALYNWGHACFDMGVNTVDDALSIYAEFKGRPLNERDKVIITSGFKKEMDKKLN